MCIYARLVNLALRYKRVRPTCCSFVRRYSLLQLRPLANMTQVDVILGLREKYEDERTRNVSEHWIMRQIEGCQGEQSPIICVNEDPVHCIRLNTDSDRVITAYRMFKKLQIVFYVGEYISQI